MAKRTGVNPFATQLCAAEVRVGGVVHYCVLVAPFVKRHSNISSKNNKYNYARYVIFHWEKGLWMKMS